MISTTPDQKLCPKCKQTKSFEEFRRDRHRDDGLSHWCAACINANRNSPKRVHRDMSKVIKQCQVCQRQLPGFMFLYAATPDRLEHRCRTCRGWLDRRTKPTLEEVVQHEQDLDDVIRMVMDDLRLEYHVSTSEIIEAHRSEFEQRVYSLLLRRGILKKWKPPIWLHRTSIPE